MSVKARLAPIFFSSARTWTYCINRSISSGGISRVSVSLFSVYAGHRFTYMFMFASKQKETPWWVVSSVAYYISIIIGCSIPSTNVLVFLTPISDIRISINFHSVVSMIVCQSDDDQESHRQKIKQTHWVGHHSEELHQKYHRLSVSGGQE